MSYAHSLAPMIKNAFANHRDRTDVFCSANLQVLCLHVVSVRTKVQHTQVKAGAERRLAVYTRGPDYWNAVRAGLMQQRSSKPPLQNCQFCIPSGHPKYIWIWKLCTKEVQNVILQHLKGTSLQTTFQAARLLCTLSTCHLNDSYVPSIIKTLAWIQRAVNGAVYGTNLCRFPPPIPSAKKPLLQGSPLCSKKRFLFFSRQAASFEEASVIFPCFYSREEYSSTLLHHKNKHTEKAEPASNIALGILKILWFCFFNFFGKELVLSLLVFMLQRINSFILGIPILKMTQICNPWVLFCPLWSVISMDTSGTGRNISLFNPWVLLLKGPWNSMKDHQSESPGLNKSEQGQTWRNSLTLPHSICTVADCNWLGGRELYTQCLCHALNAACWNLNSS